MKHFPLLLFLLLVAAVLILLAWPSPVPWGKPTATPTLWSAPVLASPTATPTPTAGWWAITPEWMATAVSPTPTPTPTPAP
ncbi:MAG TPA: hypothetical protein ENJ54_00075 [Chloroflexi bacterium]|nr:hypothetical protein [Chloroflexota bacterium]